MWYSHGYAEKTGKDPSAVFGHQADSQRGAR